MNAPQAALVRIKLIHASRHPSFSADSRLPGKVNYIFGHDPSRWIRNVPLYARIVERSIWPGVDAVWRGEGGRLETDFVVAPMANPNLISLGVEGADRIAVTAGGDLRIEAHGQGLELLKPNIYQQREGSRQTVPGRYVMEPGVGGANIVRFELGSYDHHQALVIDPVVQLAYSTFLGAGQETAFGIAVDSAGSAYVTGVTVSGAFPTTPKAFQVTPPPHQVAFVTKFSPDGTTLVYSTYLGGTAPADVFGDFGNAIAVDAHGNAYITGVAGSNDFPLKNAFQTSKLNSTVLNTAAFFTELSADGSSLLYSTYLGGDCDSQDTGNSIAVDAQGKAYLAGTAVCTNFPTTPGAFQTVFNPGAASNAFAAKFDPGKSGSASLLFSTFLGGSSAAYGDQGLAIAVDANGNPYVAGATGSTDFPIKNAFQSELGGAAGGAAANAFVTKFSADASALLYSTYLGGSTNAAGGGASDVARAIAVDSHGSAYVAGIASAANFPVTPGAFQPHLGGGGTAPSNAFVTKFSPDGSALVYSTYLGGSGLGSGFGDAAAGVAIDATGNVYVAGTATSPDFPTLFPFSHYPGTFDVFVSELSGDGSALVYSTLLGSSVPATDPTGFTAGASAIALDQSANAYIAGETNAPDFPLANPFQSSLSEWGDGRDAFVTKLFLSPASPTPFAPTPTPSPTPVIKINSVPESVAVGAAVTIGGSNFTRTTYVQGWVATANGGVWQWNLTPDISSLSPTSLTITIPASTTIGEGYVALQAISVDRDYQASNVVGTLLTGNPSAGIPTISEVNGVGLNPISSNPSYALNVIDTVVMPGSAVTLAGSGFDTANGVAVDLFYPDGKMPTIILNPGAPGLEADKITVTLPDASALPDGPGSFVVSNKGSGSYAGKSNAVSVVIGQEISLASVSQAGNLITVTGTGFSTATVINLFNLQGETVVNLGGIDSHQKPLIPLTVIDSTQFTFTLPTAAVPGPAYVQAINPPFTPFTNTGTSANGTIDLR